MKLWKISSSLNSRSLAYIHTYLTSDNMASLSVTIFDRFGLRFSKIRLGVVLERILSDHRMMLAGPLLLLFLSEHILYSRVPRSYENYAEHVTWNLRFLQWCKINGLVIIIRMYTASALHLHYRALWCLCPPPKWKYVQSVLRPIVSLNLTVTWFYAVFGKRQTSSRS